MMSSKQEIKSEFLPVLVRRNDDEKYEIFMADDARKREISHLIRKFNWKIPFTMQWRSLLQWFKEF